MCFWPGMSVFVMVCETRPLPVYPIVFQHPGLPVGGKQSIFNFMHRHVRSFLLVSLIWQPVCASNLRRRGWWKKSLQYFEFGLQYLVQPLGVNPTYSTFKIEIDFYFYFFLLYAWNFLSEFNRSEIFPNKLNWGLVQQNWISCPALGFEPDFVL